MDDPYWFEELKNRRSARMIPSLIAAERRGSGRSLLEPGTRLELRSFLAQVIETTPAEFTVRLHRCLQSGQPVMTEIDLTGEGIYGEIVGHGFYLEGEEARRKTLAVDVALIGDAPPTLYQLTDFLWGELKEPLQDCRFDYCIRDRCYKRFPKG